MYSYSDKQNNTKCNLSNKVGHEWFTLLWDNLSGYIYTGDLRYRKSYKNLVSY